MLHDVGTAPVQSHGVAIPNGNFRSYLLVLVIGLIACVPIWVPAFPAMCDAPQQSAQVAIFSQLDHPGFPFSQLFIRHVLTPNLAGYTLLFLFKPLMGLVAAWKFATSVALVGFLLATSWLMTEFGTDPRLALLGVLGIYGNPFELGLLSFLAAAPVGIVFLVFAIRYFRNPSFRRGTLLALLFLTVFFCHALVAAYAAGFAAIYALTYTRSLKRLLLFWLPVLAVGPAAGIWWVASIANQPSAHHPTEWKLGWDRVPELFTNVTGWSNVGWHNDALAAFFVVGATVPLMLLLGLRRQARFYVLLALSLLVAIFGPADVVGVGVLYKRQALCVLPFAALMLRPMAETTTRRVRLAIAWLLIVALGWTAGEAWRMTTFDRESRGFSTLLRRMDPGQRLLFVNFDSHSRAFAEPVLLHHAVWYSALKGGIADPSFACNMVCLVLYRPQSLPPVRYADFEFHPESFEWNKDEGSLYRYFVVHAPDDKSQQLFATAQPQVALRARDGDWWLYEDQQGSSSNMRLSRR